MILGALLCLILGFSFAGLETGTYALEVDEQPLPTELRRIKDIRWTTEATVLVTAARSGVFDLLVRESRIPAGALIISSRKTEYVPAMRLAVTNERAITATAVRNIAWWARGSADGSESYDFSFDIIGDIDAAGDKLAVFGAQRSADGVWFSPDGALLWFGGFAKEGDREVLSLEPIYFTPSGEGAPSFNNCGLMEPGKVRFLNDGSLLFIPGVDQGAYLYDAAGKLKQTWDTDPWGIHTGCKLSDQEGERFAASVASRHLQWINQRQLLDEIVPVEDSGFGLIVRSVTDGKTRWRFVLVDPENPERPRSVLLPMESESEMAHLKADVSPGGKLALVLNDYHADPRCDHVRLFYARLDDLLAALPPAGEAP